MPKKKQATRTAPVLWKFNSGRMGLGLFVDDTHCWMGNENGRVFLLDHEGNLQRQYKFPRAVMALVGDGDWMYAGCDNGKVYDLTGNRAHLAYEIARGEQIDWIDIRDGLLAVSTLQGRVSVIDHESRVLWTDKSGGSGGAYMVRCDGEAVYHARYLTGVTAYDRLTGKPRWSANLSLVSFGWQTEKSLHITTGQGKIVRLNKKNGTERAVYSSDNPLYCCATSPLGRRVFAGDNHGAIYEYSAGKRRWKLATDCGDPLSMQFHNGRLYFVTNGGFLACVDVSAKAIKAAKAGTGSPARALGAPIATKALKPTRQLETTTDAGSGVILECVEEESRLRMHVVSPGYRKDWHVQFPRDIRELGARYVVDEVKVATQGGFYRAYGSIKKLVPAPTRRKRS